MRPAARRQRGAALVIGLILLLVLTLLAVAGMNTASSELIMAGNEQYRQNAFRAADIGIEQALTSLASIPQTGAAQVEPSVSVADSDTGDTYATSTRYMGEDKDIPGFSAGKYVGYHYEITSTGASARNANAQNVQGAFFIQGTGSGGSFGPLAP